MPTVRDRPVATYSKAETFDRPVAAPPKKVELRQRPEPYLRWMGWLLALVVIAVAATVTAVVVIDDEPATNLGATLELRLDKDAIEAHQQAVVAAPSPVAAPGISTVRLDQLLQKDTIEEAIAPNHESTPAAGLTATLDQRLAKEAIEDGR